jgi:hypothetical protein
MSHEQKSRLGQRQEEHSVISPQINESRIIGVGCICMRKNELDFNKFYFLHRFFSFLYNIYRIWLKIWITRRVSYKKQELLALSEHLSSPPVFLVESVMLIILVFCVVPLRVFTFWVPCCDVRIKTMFGSSLLLFFLYFQNVAIFPIFA